MTGFDSKRDAAADKVQEPWNEDEWRRNNWRCSHGWLRGEQCEICNAAQEPVGQVGVIGSYGFVGHIYDDRKVKTGDKLYTTPPQRPWVGLTDEEIEVLDEATWDEDHKTWGIHDFAHVIEQALKEKNT